MESILAGFIFTIFPFAVQLNAMVFIDNGSSFFFLLTLAFTSAFVQKKQERLLAFASVSAGLAFLSKEIGIYAILFLLLFLLFTRESKKHYRWLVLAIVIASSWFVFGLILNKGLFVDVISAQSIRMNAGGQYNYQYLLNTSVSNFSIEFNSFIGAGISAILLLAWICVGTFIFSNRDKLIKLGLASFVTTLVVIRFGWYYTWIAMYPFFAIAITYTLLEIARFLLHAKKSKASVQTINA